MSEWRPYPPQRYLEEVLPREAYMSDTRYCFHCGSLLVERSATDEPRLVCPACAYAHFDSPQAVAGVIICRDHEVLLVHPMQPPGLPYPVLVSGHLEPYESAEAAAVREVAEETGLEVVIERVLGTYSCRSIGKNMLLIACVARVAGGELRLVPSKRS